MILCVVIGLALNLIGTGFAAVALARDIREHDPRPFLGRTRRWFSVHILRRREVHSGTLGLSGTVSITGRAEGRAGPPSPATVEQQIAFLLNEVDVLHRALSEHRRETRTALTKAHESVDNLRIEFDGRATKIEATMKEVAVGSARLELWGLVLIGMGTVVSTLPVLVGWK